MAGMMSCMDALRVAAQTKEAPKEWAHSDLTRTPSWPASLDELLQNPISATKKRSRFRGVDEDEFSSNPPTTSLPSTPPLSSTPLAPSTPATHTRPSMCAFPTSQSLPGHPSLPAGSSSSPLQYPSHCTSSSPFNSFPAPSSPFNGSPAPSSPLYAYPSASSPAPSSPLQQPTFCLSSSPAASSSPVSSSPLRPSSSRVWKRAVSLPKAALENTFVATPSTPLAYPAQPPGAPSTSNQPSFGNSSTPPHHHPTQPPADHRPRLARMSSIPVNFSSVNPSASSFPPPVPKRRKPFDLGWINAVASSTNSTWTDQRRPGQQEDDIASTAVLENQFPNISLGPAPAPQRSFSSGRKAVLPIDPCVARVKSQENSLQRPQPSLPEFMHWGADLMGEGDSHSGDSATDIWESADYEPPFRRAATDPLKGRTMSVPKGGVPSFSAHGEYATTGVPGEEELLPDSIAEMCFNTAAIPPRASHPPPPRASAMGPFRGSSTGGGMFLSAGPLQSHTNVFPGPLQSHTNVFPSGSASGFPLGAGGASCQRPPASCQHPPASQSEDSSSCGGSSSGAAGSSGLLPHCRQPGSSMSLSTDVAMDAGDGAADMEATSPHQPGPNADILGYESALALAGEIGEGRRDDETDRVAAACIESLSNFLKNSESNNKAAFPRSASNPNPPSAPAEGLMETQQQMHQGLSGPLLPHRFPKQRPSPLLVDVDAITSACSDALDDICGATAGTPGGADGLPFQLQSAHTPGSATAAGSALWDGLWTEGLKAELPSPTIVGNLW